MAVRLHQLSGVLLEVQPRADRYIRWCLLSAQEGFVNITAPAKIAMPYSLFDEVELTGSLRSKNVFLKEAHLVKRHDGLAHSLPALTEASELANLMRAAFREMPDYAPIYEIFARALEYYQTGAPPPLVTLKALYKMLQAEGFPIREDWLAPMGPASLRATTEALLQQEVGTPINPEGLELLPVILKDLRGWMARELGVR